MEIYCLEDFKIAFEKLKSKKSYKTIEEETINYFFNKTSKELCSGTRLNLSADVLFIKKRLGGRGAFRVYFLLTIKNDSLFLMFIHPKSGPLGSSNITDESKVYLYKKVLECIRLNDLCKLSLDLSQKKIVFSK